MILKKRPLRSHEIEMVQDTVALSLGSTQHMSTTANVLHISFVVLNRGRIQ